MTPAEQAARDHLTEALKARHTADALRRLARLMGSEEGLASAASWDARVTEHCVAAAALLPEDPARTSRGGARADDVTDGQRKP